jgi:LPS-assembly protein
VGRPRVLLLSCLLCLPGATTTFAQQAAEPRSEGQTQPGGTLLDRFNSKQFSFACTADSCTLTGQVELPLDSQTKLFADKVEMFRDTNRLVATGNVVFSNPEGRLASERLEYDVEANTGTFHVASGLMSLGDKADRRQFGNQDADVYFFGETIEKLGPRRYKITRGGFTTCVQPTPRWEMTSGSVVLNLNDYAIARNTVLRVKGVPVMYLPLIYYPIRNDDRATGFLLPTYGTSTLRGQALSNAFFWAIGRSQDATFFHDWYTRTGQGAGAQYRYVAAAQSTGDVRFYRFSQREVQFNNDGQTQTLAASNSFEVTGNVSHALTRSIRARARLDYFSDILSQQLYHQNIYQASRNRRLIEAGLTAGLGALSTSVLYQRNELFNTATSTQVYGSTPRVTTSLAPQRLFNAPIYTSVNAEYAFLPYQVTTDGDVVRDDSHSRLDVTPTVRVPLSRLTFLSINASAAYHTTYYSRSVGGTSDTTVVDDPYLRRYMTLRSEFVGPVFTRIWDLEGGFAERLKHVVEPAVTIDFTSRITDYTRTPVVSDVSDFVVSGSTRVTYGLTNRFFSRGRTVENVRGQTREFITVGLQQTYYSNAQSGGYDSAYQSTYGYGRRLDLSPISFTTRVSPSNSFDTNVRIEYDVSGGGLQMLSTGVTLNAAAASAGVNYSHRSSDDSHYVSGTTTMRWLDGRANGTYGIGWDIGRSYVQNQSVMVSYLAQCCGLQFEFQKFNYAQSAAIPITTDTRFNFGFILAGLGTFSNFFGAFGGQR